MYWLVDNEKYTTSFCVMNNSQTNHIDFPVQYFSSGRDFSWSDLSQRDSSWCDLSWGDLIEARF